MHDSADRHDTAAVGVRANAALVAVRFGVVVTWVVGSGWNMADWFEPTPPNILGSLGVAAVLGSVGYANAAGLEHRYSNKNSIRGTGPEPGHPIDSAVGSAVDDVLAALRVARENPTTVPVDAQAALVTLSRRAAPKSGC
nr:hypothetical protein GCM10017611_06210 [Rhodococcus wratislaviensis]